LRCLCFWFSTFLIHKRTTFKKTGLKNTAQNMGWQKCGVCDIALFKNNRNDRRYYPNDACHNVLGRVNSKQKILE
jgi:hypothetical protein